MPLSARLSDGSSAERERLLLGAIIQHYDQTLPENLARLINSAPESFDDAQHGAIAVAIRKLRQMGKLADSVSVAKIADVPIASLFVFDLCENALSLELAEYDSRQVWQAYQDRRARSVLSEALEGLNSAPSQADSILKHALDSLESLVEKPSCERLPVIIDACDFMAQSLPEPSELITGILHQGSKLVLGGGSKSFKTWMLLDLALSVSHGVPWLGHPTAKGRVLFINFEVQPWSWQKRIKAVAEAKGIELEPGRISFWNLRGKAANFQQLLPQIRERAKSGFALIILDPIYKLYGQTDENKASDVAALLNGLEDLAVESGAAVAFGAHFSKGNQAGKESIDRISGSGVFARDPDSLLVFTKHETDSAFTVEATLRNFAPVDPFVVRWQYPLMAADGSLDPAKLKKVGGRKKEHDAEELLDVLSSASLTTGEWQKAAETEAGIKERNFFTLLKELQKSKRIIKSVINQKWQRVST